MNTQRNIFLARLLIKKNIKNPIDGEKKRNSYIKALVGKCYNTKSSQLYI